MRLAQANFLIILSTIFALINGAVVRHCTGFEGKLGAFTPQLRVESYHTDRPSTVLISYLNGFDNALMNEFELDTTVNVPEHWYSFSKNESGSIFNESVVLKRHNQFEALNTELKYGESVVYDATYAGIYCVLVHQDADSVVGVDVTSNHIYGSYSLTWLYWPKIVVLILITYLIHHFALPWLFPDINETHMEETFWYYLTYALIGKFCDGIGKLVTLGIYHAASWNKSVELCLESPWLNQWSLMNHLISLAVIVLFYRVSVGVLSFTFDDPSNRFIGVIFMFLFEQIFMPMILPPVTSIPFSLIIYSLVCDWEAAIYALIISMGRITSRSWNVHMKTRSLEDLEINNNDVPVIRGESGTPKDLPEDYRKLSWGIPLVLSTAIPIVTFMFRMAAYYPNHSFHDQPFDIYRFNDPSTSYNYIIMWNVLCDAICSLPGILMAKMLNNKS